VIIKYPGGPHVETLADIALTLDAACATLRMVRDQCKSMSGLARSSLSSLEPTARAFRDAANKGKKVPFLEEGTLEAQRFERWRLGLRRAIQFVERNGGDHPKKDATIDALSDLEIHLLKAAPGVSPQTVQPERVDPQTSVPVLARAISMLREFVPDDDKGAARGRSDVLAGLNDLRKSIGSRQRLDLETRVETAERKLELILDWIRTSRDIDEEIFG